PADGLAVTEQERHFAAAHFQHGTAARASRWRMSKARIEKARIMHAEFTHKRIEWHHFSRVGGRNMHRLIADQNVELVGIEDQLGAAAIVQWLPEVQHVQSALAI